MLRNYDILDTPFEVEFDEIVKLASQFCETPIAIINLIDKGRQWFKSEIGFGVRETPLDNSICAHAILQSEMFIVEDTMQDPRFSCNPLVTGDPNLRFYAGALLKTSEGLPLGTLCVLDYTPRELTETQLFTLKALARQVMTLIEYRRCEKEKLATQKRLEIAFHAPEFTGFWNWNLKSNLIVADARFAKMYGVDEELAARGAPLEEFTKNIHPEDMVRITPSIQRTIEQGDKYSEIYRLIQPDKSTQWIAARGLAYYDAEGNVASFEGVAIDITTRKLTEEALQNKDLRLNTALQAGRMGTWELDVTNAHLTCSPTCKANYGLKAEDDFSYQGLAKLIYEDDLVYWNETVGNAIATCSDFEMEYRTKWPDQSIHWIYVLGSCTQTANGKAAMLAGVSIDITSRKNLEMAALEAQERAEAANVAKTEFLANMSHEIRTPMNAVIGLSNILARSEPLLPKQREFIKTLQMSADSLLGLINDLLDIAKIEARSVELERIPFSVVKIVQETVSMMNVRASEKGLTFNVEQDCTCIEKRVVLGDPTRLRQILLNLCSNAIKFTEKGGISIHISCTPIANETSELIKIAVKDSGIGIPANKIDDIFHKFTQADSSMNRKYGGTGLGLAITKTLAEIMGGTIELKSEMGVGSTFTVSIPLEITTNNNAHITSNAENKTTSAKPEIQAAILLVEDYAPNVLVASTFLESFGYTVDVAVNGTEAVDKVKTNDYVAVLMDVQMHGMNGLDATQIIRNYEKQTGKPRTHIIGMTAHALAGDRERCIAVGMDDYISKPFNPDMLERMLMQVGAAISV